MNLISKALQLAFFLSISNCTIPQPKNKTTLIKWFITKIPQLLEAESIITKYDETENALYFTLLKGKYDWLSHEWHSLKSPSDKFTLSEKQKQITVSHVHLQKSQRAKNLN